MKPVQTLSTIEKAIFLSELDLFKEVEADDLALIAAKSMEYEFEVGDIVDKDSDISSSLHVIIKGNVEVSRNGIVLRQVLKGMFFGLGGLLGLMQNEEIKVLEPTHTIALSREDFKQTIADDPEFALSMIRSVTAIALKITRRLEALEKKAG